MNTRKKLQPSPSSTKFKFALATLWVPRKSACDCVWCVVV